MSRVLSNLKKTLTNILGGEIELEDNSVKDEASSIDERTLFIDSINKWQNAWKKQNTLFNKYGIDFSGYDSLLYEALEGILLTGFGGVKYSIITKFIYSSLDSEENALKIVDNKGKEYYISNVEELYEFIIKINDKDFLKKK